MQIEYLIPAFLRSTHLYSLQTKVIFKEKNVFEFADSIFHPQGGGQPNDKGWVIKGEDKFDILKGTMNR